MDETPIKAGRKGKGQLKSGYFWPIWGDTDDGGGGDIVFLYRPSRAAIHVREGLGENGADGAVLLTTATRPMHATPSAPALPMPNAGRHPRRLRAGQGHRARGGGRGAGAHRRALCRVEAAIREHNLTGEAKRAYRLTHAKPVVDAFFDWAEAQLEHAALLPSNPLTKALHYALERRDGPYLYLSDPDVPIDTNHLERALRPIPMGRKNWMFCWSEVGAEAVATCKA
jgi:transposase